MQTSASFDDVAVAVERGLEDREPGRRLDGGLAAIDEPDAVGRRDRRSTSTGIGAVAGAHSSARVTTRACRK